MPENDPEFLIGFAGPAGWTLLSILLMAASGFVALGFRRLPTFADRVGAVLLGLGAAVGLLAAGASIGLSKTPSIQVPWTLPWGRFSIAIDGLSAAFLLPFALIPALAAIYGLGYWSQRSRPESGPRVRVFLGMLAGALAMLVIARDAILFLMAFEVVTLCAFFLVTTEHEKREVRDAGWLYLAASHGGFILLLGLFTGLQRVGGTFDLTAIAPGTAGIWTRTGLFLLALVGFGVKAGVMPLHFWLPSAHANSPSHVSAVLSGVVLKVGIYGLMRVLMILPDPPMVWGLLLLVLGVFSAVGGVAFALGQHDLKRLLAYHSIENIGIIVMGLGMAMIGRWAHEPLLVALGFGAAILHVWNHAIFKSLLFLSAGNVIRIAGTRNIDRLGGLGRLLPWSASLFTLGAVAICGLPPLNGFVSEFILFVGALRSLGIGATGLAALIAPALALVGALACACFVKVIGAVFLGLRRHEEQRPAGLPDASARECGWTMRAPMVILALLCVVLGIAPMSALPALDAASSAWMGSDADGLPPLATAVPFGAITLTGAAVALAAGLLCFALIRSRRMRRTAGTWSCGYIEPGPRMQYTGSSFGSVLVGLFRFLLRSREDTPIIQGIAPRPAAYHGHVVDFVLDRWLLPATRRFADQCNRIHRLQSIRTQACIVYIVAATLGLLLLVVPASEVLRRLLTR